MKNEILADIWEAFKEQILKKTWFKVVMIVSILVLAFLIYFLTSRSSVTLGEIGNQTVWKSYQEVIQLEQGEDKVVLEELNSEKIDTVLNLFFFMANEGNQNLFTSAIDNERLAKDFEQVPLNERFQKYNEAMNKISRGGTLSSVEVVRSIPHLQKNTQRIVLDLYYLDLTSPIRVSVLVTSYEQYNVNEAEGDMYKIPYISSSLWELIEAIEKGVEVR